jgi:hypothetical protein
MTAPFRTSNSRKFKKVWLSLGGTVESVRGTGELRYLHPKFKNTVRANDRRTDVPAVLLRRANHLMKLDAANDPIWNVERK